ncbi:MAG: L-serine ammonia-lyase, iron-sulfur-dependent, subunit alpha [Sedimentibacter sp.]|uniref:L-cysteine desulfidase family protein n=1 Tax=Sedimentibacter sp. TaxID=1960295 RepID=UPI0031583F80
MYEGLLSILHKEVKPALGCTGPTSVSYAASVAKDAVGGEVKSVKVFVDRDTYKNSIAVGIPGTSEMGVVIAAALGAVCGDSTLGLEVLKNVTKEDEEKAKTLAEHNVSLEINWDIEGVGLYIDVWVDTDLGTGHAIVAKTHTNVILIEANNEIKYKVKEDEIKNILDETKDIIAGYTVKDFYDFATKMPIEELNFLKESINMNKELAETGLEKGSGKGFGEAFLKLQKTQSAFFKAKAYTAAASDARMAGENLPAMSCASSGNVGITASLPLYIVALENGINEDILIRALSLSFLMTIYIKNHIGRLSAMCACAIAASIGVGTGTVILFEGSFSQVEGAVKNIVGSIGGVLCDGAKLGCALKLSSAVGIAIESAYMALDNTVIASGDGIVCDTADETIKMLGRIARLGMIETDKVLCKEIIQREQNSKRYN